MMPILYCADEKIFNSNGLGVLSDTADCTVTEILNSSYEMELKYPVIPDCHRAGGGHSVRSDGHPHGVVLHRWSGAAGHFRGLCVHVWL